MAAAQQLARAASEATTPRSPRAPAEAPDQSQPPSPPRLPPQHVPSAPSRLQVQPRQRDGVLGAPEPPQQQASPPLPLPEGAPWRAGLSMHAHSSATVSGLTGDALLSLAQHALSQCLPGHATSDASCGGASPWS